MASSSATGVQVSTARNFRKIFLIPLVRHGFYPLTLAITLLFIYLKTTQLLGDPKLAYGIYLTALVTIMLLLEWSMPARQDWSMSWRSFLRRDVPMMLVNGAAIGAAGVGITAFSAWVFVKPQHHFLPWWAEAIATILISDFIWYWVHRSSHEARGRLGNWLWKTHVQHHIPKQVYVFMHGVGHPMNGAYVKVILMLPAAALGFGSDAIFAASVLTGFQGLISHFNVDIRAGYLNRIFMGTELHRYHHSAAMQEGRNYAAVITIWDQLFGTYDYHPGTLPAALGVHEPDLYPKDEQLLRMLAIPFK